MAAIWGSIISAFTTVFNLLFQLTGSYGLAIILLTIAIRLLLWPLTHSQAMSMRRMQQLQPEIEKLNKKYKNNKEKLNEETMKLWKENGVNPAAGCLPVLVQIPFLYAIFELLRDYQFTGDASFLWIPNLSQPDPFYVLPILAGAATFWQSKITMPPGNSANAATQQMMMYFMPIFIAWITIQFPAGLGIYWFISSLFSVGQQYLIPKPDTAVVKEGSRS